MKLSKAQQRAFSKLTQEWQSSKALDETVATLNALMRKVPDQVETIINREPLQRFTEDTFASSLTYWYFRLKESNTLMDGSK